jgi:uncharacterized protein (DUF1499 family)
MNAIRPVSTSPVSTSTAASLSAVVAVLAIVALLAGPALVHAGALPPLGGFLLAGTGLAFGSLLAIVLGLIGLLRTRSGARRGRGRAWLGLGIGTLLGLMAIGLTARAPKVPRIHDITTDPEDAPRFTRALEHADNAGRDLAYPHGGAEVPAQQREAYPDLAPVRLSLPPDQAFERARRAAEALGWTVTWADPAAGLFEATETTRVFRFVDDVVVRVRPAEGGSVVDVRSTSRVGQSDFGLNAQRIRAFVEKLRAGA